MTTTPVLGSIVAWLRAGYPYGVPEQDYVPLLALLARRLTNEEVVEVAQELGRQGEPIEPADIGALITKVTNELPRNEDVARVREQLATAGPFI
jgi:uncharacterized protein YcgL (UPF0745 family)